MNPASATVSPLRQRMIEDMRMRRLAPATQGNYMHSVCLLAKFLDRRPDRADAEDLRRFQLSMVERGRPAGSVNAVITGLHFFFDITLGRPELLAKMQSLRVPRTLPLILGRHEVAALIEKAPSVKFAAAFSVAYGAGLRAGEVARLRASDVHSDRMMLRIEQGKGGKDRDALLSPALLQRLRAWWKHAHAMNAVRADGWLFPGRDPLTPLNRRQLNDALRQAAQAAGIAKPVSMHCLRHTFATHLLEQKVDIRVIQVLLGHDRLETTSMYTQVASGLLREVVSPLDTLPLP